MYPERFGWGGEALCRDACTPLCGEECAPPPAAVADSRGEFPVVPVPLPPGEPDPAAGTGILPDALKFADAFIFADAFKFEKDEDAPSRVELRSRVVPERSLLEATAAAANVAREAPVALEEAAGPKPSAVVGEPAPPAPSTGVGVFRMDGPRVAARWREREGDRDERRTAVSRRKDCPAGAVRCFTVSDRARTTAVYLPARARCRAVRPFPSTTVTDAPEERRRFVTPK